jgi:ribosome-associated toxin RatA of RatAB toxin-antitoxin module
MCVLVIVQSVVPSVQLPHSMKHVKKSVLLWYSPREMADLVTRVEAYPEFLPWCERAEVLQTHDDGVTARLHLAYAGVRHSFTTRNQRHPDHQVVVSLVDGPFSVLDGTWGFTPLTLPGSDENSACKIEFDLRYAFSSRALELVVSPVFDRIANTFVDSFVMRAEQVYGAR